MTRSFNDKASALLYLTYDGILEPLGQSQVPADLERLAVDRPIHLLSFEKAKDWRDVAARICVSGVHWHPRRYHKPPSALATAWDIGIDIASGLWLALRHRIGIVHARRYLPAGMALMLQKLTSAKFVFDIRGFWVDERVDGGLWPRDGCMCRVARWFEQRFLRRVKQYPDRWLPDWRARWFV